MRDYLTRSFENLTRYGGMAYTTDKPEIRLGSESQKYDLQNWMNSAEAQAMCGGRAKQRINPLKVQRLPEKLIFLITGQSVQPLTDNAEGEEIVHEITFMLKSVGEILARSTRAAGKL